MDEIELLCLKFREAIVKCPKNLLPITFRWFPLGACGDASLVLAKFLQDNGHGGFDYVLAYRGEKSHAWLEKDGLIIDITANQFDDKLPDVIVTASRDFHRQFIEDRRNKADLSRYDDRSRGELSNACMHICQYLED